MACACKRNKLLKSVAKNNSKNQKKKNNFSYYINMIFDSINAIVLGRILMSAFIFCVVLVLMPLLMLSLVITQVIEGRARIIVPNNIMRKIKRIEQVKNGE